MRAYLMLALFVLVIPRPALGGATVGPGACCTASGGQSFCERVPDYSCCDGTFQPGVTCSQAACDEVGACCQSSGECLDNISSFACGLNPKVTEEFFPLQSCAEVDAATCTTLLGACCTNSGDCVDYVLQGDCDGAWSRGEFCIDNPCNFPNPVACCLPGGGQISCQEIDEADCMGLVLSSGSCPLGACEAIGVGACCAEDGTCDSPRSGPGCGANPNLMETFFTGFTCDEIDASDCSSLLGACCTDDGQCVDDVLQDDCSGSFFRDERCVNNPCDFPEPVACCEPGSGVYHCSQLSDIDDCQGIAFPGGQCGEVPCGVVAYGACCNGNAGECRDTVSAGCDTSSAGQEQFFPRFRCDEIDQEFCLPPSGSCCLVELGNASCINVNSESECAGFFIQGTRCNEVECDIPGFGACCLGGTGCIDYVSAFACSSEFSDQATFVEGLTCDNLDPDTCMPKLGACCRTEASNICADDLTEEECVSFFGAGAGGDFWLAGATCDDLGPPCNGDDESDSGGCCLPESCACEIASQTVCEQAWGGVYLGDRTDCSGACVPSDPIVNVEGSMAECAEGPVKIMLTGTIEVTDNCPSQYRGLWETECTDYILTPSDDGLSAMMEFPAADCACGTECSVTFTAVRDDFCETGYADTASVVLKNTDTPTGGGRGSLLYWSDVEVKFDENDNVVMDTFLEITNDANEGVYVQFYFVNGDDPLDAMTNAAPPFNTLERSHPGWNFVDTQIYLTPNQSEYFSAATGDNAGASSLAVAPFPNLDPDPSEPGDPDFSGTGRPDPDGNLRTVRGVVIAWAVDIDGLEVKHNKLTGSALKVDYLKTEAWEYDAVVFSRLACTTGDLRLPLDGREYEPSPARLLLSFYTVGAEMQSNPTGGGAGAMDTDLSIHPLTFDFRPNGLGPVSTLVQADVWNQNEIRFSGAERCITCWDQTLLSRFQNGDDQGGNMFLRSNLQTNKGKARLTGFAEGCPELDTIATPLLGVQVKLLSDPAGAVYFGGSRLGWDGVDDTAVIYGRPIAGVELP